MQEFEISNQIFLMMSQNFTRYNLITGVLRIPLNIWDGMLFAQTVNTFKSLNGRVENSVLDVWKVLSMPLLQNKAGKVCKKELWTPLREI